MWGFNAMIFIQLNGHLIVLQQAGLFLFEKPKITFKIHIGMNNHEKPLKFI